MGAGGKWRIGQWVCKSGIYERLVGSIALLTVGSRFKWTYAQCGVPLVDS